MKTDFGDESTGLAASGLPGASHGALLVVVVRGVVQEFLVPPRGTPLVVGRSSACPIHIDDASVSRQHARIIPVDDGYLVQDLNSKNGTWVNGNRIGDQPMLIRPGDAVRFGHVVAQLSLHRRSRMLLPRRLSPTQFDERVADEGERCVRYERNLVLLAIEMLDRSENAAVKASAALTEHLRTLDVITVREPGRLDVLLADCAPEDGQQAAMRIYRAFEAAQLRARVGVASYPGDVGSIETLHIAARTAMQAVRSSGIEISVPGVSTVQLGQREIIVAEPAMVRLFALVERVASSATPVLISGETGSGKEIVAEAVHALGTRASRRLVKLNCAAFPEQLLESELFGHERGAFTGAEVTKPGIFEDADGGTLFLDEIGEMPPALQAKLLRVLEDKKVRRLGATREKAVDVRFVAATHRDLKAMAAAGKFRDDLYYRLGAIVLRVPPLRERPREISLLAQRFGAAAAAETREEFAGFSSEALHALETYTWPGNVRELRNVIAGAILLAGPRRVELEDLPAELRGSSVSKPAHEAPRQATSDASRATPGRKALEEELRNVERERIVQALEVCGGNQTRAAEYLQMPRRTLVRKIALLGIGAGTRARRPTDADG